MARMVFDDIREQFRVPAYQGAKITLDGRKGRITGTWGPDKITVNLYGDIHSRIVCPLDVEYAETGADLTAPAKLGQPRAKVLHMPWESPFLKRRPVM